METFFPKILCLAGTFLVAAVASAQTAVLNWFRGGFVKAMLFVEADGTISRCYNGVAGSSANGCGFSVGYSQSGESYLF